ncbi:MAG: ribosomal protein S18-alanine N-acetyltransferase [Planctomycetota bacterium]
MSLDPHTTTDLRIRWLVRGDMPAVVELETLSFEFAWTEDDFLACLRQRNCIGMVAEDDDEVVGYMIYELLPGKLRVVNFAVAPHRRREGIGSRMVSRLVEKLEMQRRTEISLEVRETNLSAQLFFKNRDFKAVGVLHDRYDETDEDAYAMRYRLPQDEVAAEFHPRNRVRDYFADAA